jgi:hypothetical protein
MRSLCVRLHPIIVIVTPEPGQRWWAPARRPRQIAPLVGLGPAYVVAVRASGN